MLLKATSQVSWHRETRLSPNQNHWTIWPSQTNSFATMRIVYHRANDINTSHQFHKERIILEGMVP